MYRYSEVERKEITAARKKNKDKRAEKRLHALELRAAGKSAKEVSEATGFHQAYITTDVEVSERWNRSNLWESLWRQPPEHERRGRGGTAGTISGEGRERTNHRGIGNKKEV